MNPLRMDISIERAIEEWTDCWLRSFDHDAPLCDYRKVESDLANHRSRYERLNAAARRSQPARAVA